jgi:hypothetical protein
VLGLQGYTETQECGPSRGDLLLGGWFLFGRLFLGGLFRRFLFGRFLCGLLCRCLLGRFFRRGLLCGGLFNWRFLTILILTF